MVDECLDATCRLQFSVLAQLRGASMTVVRAVSEGAGHTMESDSRTRPRIAPVRACRPAPL